MSNTSEEHPPTFHAVNSIELSSTEASKITAVSVYSGRAEVTRTFKFKVKTGQNQITVNGLPNVLDQDSLRVEGHGAATIHDVSISWMPPSSPPKNSPALTALLAQREKTLKALERCKKSLEALRGYMATIRAQYVEASQLGKVIKEFDTAAEEWDDRNLELDTQLADVDKEIEKERVKLAGPKRNDKLNLRATIGVFADVEDEVEMSLIYAVHGASWVAGYDIRVNSQTKDPDPVTLIYKAAITQSTGEDWSDIPLILETASPTFGVGVPTLEPWKLSQYKPIVLPPRPVAYAALPGASITRSRGSVVTPDDASSYGAERERSVVGHRQLEVSSKGNVNATFQVPGLLTIPSDGAAHNVTIAELKLNAAMSWVCVPKKDTKTHLSAKIKNASEYTLLQGTASVYVDGSFISRTNVPAVSPDESFDCALGIDPSIRVTYHPRIKKRSQSGFYSKTATNVFTQNITVFNTKPTTTAERVRIVEQVPVSEDTEIQVALVSPALMIGKDLKSDAATRLVTVAKGVTALWQGADDPEPDVGALGRNGAFNWVCTVPPQTKVNLVLQWEVTAPEKLHVVGLN